MGKDTIIKSGYMNYNESGGSKIGEVFEDRETAVRQSNSPKDSTAIPVEIIFNYIDKNKS